MRCPSRKQLRIELVKPEPVDASHEVIQRFKESPYMSSWADTWLGESGQNQMESLAALPLEHSLGQGNS
eukprot:11637810-Karenia_brevis.AAC.1